MPRPYLELSEVEALADNGGYAGLFYLNNYSVAILLSAMTFVRNLGNWQGASYSLSDSEIDAIDAYCARIETELMTSMIGTIIPFATSVIPSGMLLCDGTQYAREDYPELYAVLDSAFIVDTDNFIVPDLQGLFIKGASGDNPGDTGGSHPISLSSNELPSHSHSYATHSLIPLTIGAGAPVTFYNIPDLPAVSGSTGSGNSFDARPPYLVLQYGIISGRP